MGTSPVGRGPEDWPDGLVVSEYEKQGLRHKIVRYSFGHLIGYVKIGETDTGRVEILHETGITCDDGTWVGVAVNPVNQRVVDDSGKSWAPARGYADVWVGNGRCSVRTI